MLTSPLKHWISSMYSPSCLSSYQQMSPSSVSSCSSSPWIALVCQSSALPYVPLSPPRSLSPDCLLALTSQVQGGQLPAIVCLLVDCFSWRSPSCFRWWRSKRLAGLSRCSPCRLCYPSRSLVPMSCRFHEVLLVCSWRNWCFRGHIWHIFFPSSKQVFLSCVWKYSVLKNNPQENFGF